MTSEALNLKCNSSLLALETLWSACYESPANVECWCPRAFVYSIFPCWSSCQKRLYPASILCLLLKSWQRSCDFLSSAFQQHPPLRLSQRVVRLCLQIEILLEDYKTRRWKKYVRWELKWQNKRLLPDHTYLLAIHDRQSGYKGVASSNFAKLTLRSKSFMI